MSKTVKAADLHAEWMRDPAYRGEYEALDLEFRVAAAIIDARSRAGLTQAQLAERMNTSRTVVVRLEGGRTLPSLATLRKVAAATGHSINLEIA
ncbi:helix-turn-helix transcriptional regulator [Thalassobaculum sp.]|uniref:helix-turn-helix domain-containing protein n=1 Tax=Thalassobaculum sp. TaxID=2022740 RepID=UPI0032F098D8